MTHPSGNRAFYERGKYCARRVSNRIGSTWDERTTVTEIANEDGEDAKEVRVACEFARHVDVVPRARGATHETPEAKSGIEIAAVPPGSSG